MSSSQQNARIAAVMWVFAIAALIVRHHAWHIIPASAAAFAVWCLLNSLNDSESSENLAFDGIFFWITVIAAIFSECVVLIFGG